LKSKIKSNIFHWFYLFLYCILLWLSNQKVLIYATHIKKVIAKLHSYTLRSKITDKKIIGQKFRRGQKCRLAPAYRSLLNRTFVTALEAELQAYRRILNTIRSLGTTLLQSGTLIPKLVTPS